jgi:aromatic ring-opening dioxygenase catalytic subunit (LigB family)
VLVFFLPDHFVDFLETIPTFSVGIAESAPGPCDYPEQPRREIPIDSDLAAAIHTHLLACDFDVALSQELRLDHSSIVPLGVLTPDFDTPIVAIRINAFKRPLASARRCYELGKRVREAIEQSGAGKRVAVLSTGNFSLDIGGPRMSSRNYTSIPDGAWVERVIELIREGRYEQLIEEATAEQIDKAGMEAGEILLWAAMLGTLDAQPPEYLEAQLVFGHAYAAWPLRPVERA